MPVPDESKVVRFRVIEGSKPAAVPAPDAPDNREELASTLEAAAAEVRAGEYDGVFVILRITRGNPNAGGDVDVMYSTTTDPEKAWMLDKAKEWLLTPTED